MLLQHRRPPCPKDTKPPAPKARAAKPAKTKQGPRRENEVGSRSSSIYFTLNDTFFGTSMFPERWSLKKLYFLSILRVRSSSKAHAQGHAFIIRACAWHAPCFLFNSANAFLVVNLQHTTITHECKWRWRRVFRTRDPGENILAYSNSRCYKTEQRQAEAHQLTITSWCSQFNHDSVTQFRNTWPSFKGFQDSVRRVPYVLSQQAPPLSCKHLPLGKRSGTAALWASIVGQVIFSRAPRN